MLLTEKEAAGKWCVKGDVVSEKCVSARCMAWRWYDHVTDDGTACTWLPTALEPRNPEPNPEIGRPLSDRRGYCGLAGNPAPRKLGA